jgi:hypothetical protein
MATIKKQWEDGMVEGWKSIILESDTEIETLPISVADDSKVVLQGYSKLAIGSEAFCPSTGNAFVLTKAGWLKIT